MFFNSDNVAFTTKKQYVEYVDKLEDFLESNEITDMNKELFEELSIILEKHTNINNPNKVLNAVSYVFVEFYKKSLTNIIFSIGETNDSRKIKWYRNIIKHSFEDVEETERLDSYGKIMYYYKINDINIKKQL